MREINYNCGINSQLWRIVFLPFSQLIGHLSLDCSNLYKIMLY